MTVQLNTLTSAPGSRKKSVRVGRGNASGHGTFSGKGIKGQRARSGGRKHLRRRGLKQMLLQLPKERGFNTQFSKPEVVNLSQLASKFPAQAKVTPDRLRQLNLIRRSGWVKVLGDGKLNHSLDVSAHAFSASAKTAIEKAGGKVTILTQPQQPLPKRQLEKRKAAAAQQ